MSRPIHINHIREMINASEKGAIFVPSDFSHIADPVQVGICLKRMCKHAELECVMRGVYIKPGKYPPKKEDVARAIARGRGWTAVPCGQSALYAAGLSDFSPSEWTFVCDGMYRTYKYDDNTLVFKHTDMKDEITGVSYETALCIQALRAIGKGNITDEQIKTLARGIKLADKKPVYYGTQKITTWIRECLKIILAEASKNAPGLQENGSRKHYDNRKISTPFGFEVNSKAEALIAAYLHMAGLDFTYEHSLVSWDGVPMLPDFKIVYKGAIYYWEHLGLLDDAEYVREWIEKKRIYSTNFTGMLLTTDENSDIGAQILKILHDKFDINIV